MTTAFVIKTLVVAAATAGAMNAAFAQEPGQRREQEAPPTVSSSQIIGSQGADEWLASQLRGTAVVSSDNQKIGEVVDILLDRNGQARAFVVGEGGVGGLGAREIAIDLSQFHEVPANGGGKAQLQVRMTREQLAAVPEFKPLPSPEETTGAAPGR
jgi:hypothetical protein